MDHACSRNRSQLQLMGPKLMTNRTIMLSVHFTNRTTVYTYIRTLHPYRTLRWNNTAQHTSVFSVPADKLKWWRKCWWEIDFLLETVYGPTAKIQNDDNRNSRSQAYLHQCESEATAQLHAQWESRTRFPSSCGGNTESENVKGLCGHGLARPMKEAAL